MIDAAMRDVQHCLSRLRRQPGFAAIAILTLALGAGVSATLFSVVDSTLLHPLPYLHPEQLVEIDIGRGLAPSLEDVRAWNAADTVVTDIAIKRTVFPKPVVESGVIERLESVRVSERYFPLFGVTPHLGRGFRADDVAIGSPETVLISYQLWRGRFESDSNILGRVLRIDGGPATIIGVLPREFGAKVPLWRPLRVEPGRVTNRGSGWRVYGRLMQTTDTSSAAARLAALLPGHEDAMRGTAVSVKSMRDDVRSTYRTTVLVLASTVGVIVLLACVNVAGLLLAQGAARQTEMAVRSSLGAGRSRLIRQMLMESLVLSLLGGLAGIGLAWLTGRAIVSNLGVVLPDDAPARINIAVLVATAGLTTVTGLAVGIVPALRHSRVRLLQPLGRSGRHHGASLSHRGGQILIAIEVALAVLTLAAAGLMLRSLSRLASVDLGFDQERILILNVEPIEHQHSVYASYYPALVSAIQGLPSVEAAGAGDSVPVGGLSRFGSVAKPGGRPVSVLTRTVLPGYFEALGIPLVGGRPLTENDRHGGSGVVVINQRAARRFFADAFPVGQWLDLAKRPIEVVGVVADIRGYGPQSQAEPELYLPFRPDLSSRIPPTPMVVVVRPREESVAVAEQVQHVATTLGPPVLFDGLRRGGDLIAETIDRPRQRTVLLTILGALGMTLAIIGVLGITSYAVRRRTHEIGVRLAIGAQPSQVVATVCRSSLLAILVGLLLGTGGALLATKLIRSFLFQTSPTDPVTLGVVAATMGLVGGAAAWIPARQSAHIDPVESLRAE